MAHFLLIYDRSTGLLIRNEQYDSGVEAMRARFKAEIEFDERPEVEVAALDAASEEELRRTHGRYFYSLTELADRLAS